jgi:phage baseplate assembly protein W
MERAIVLPFSIDESGSIYSSNDQRKIWQSRVITAVMTHVGERVFRLNYGGTVRDSLFENADTAGDIVRGTVRSVFSSLLPKLVLNNVDTVMDYELGILDVTIYYALPNGDKDEVTVRTATLSRSGDVIQEY